MEPKNLTKTTEDLPSEVDPSTTVGTAAGAEAGMAAGAAAGAAAGGGGEAGSKRERDDSEDAMGVEAPEDDDDERPKIQFKRANRALYARHPRRVIVRARRGDGTVLVRLPVDAKGELPDVIREGWDGPAPAPDEDLADVDVPFDGVAVHDVFAESRGWLRALKDRYGTLAAAAEPDMLNDIVERVRCAAFFGVPDKVISRWLARLYNALYVLGIHATVWLTEASDEVDIFKTLMEHHWRWVSTDPEPREVDDAFRNKYSTVRKIPFEIVTRALGSADEGFRAGELSEYTFATYPQLAVRWRLGVGIDPALHDEVMDMALRRDLRRHPVEFLEELEAILTAAYGVGRTFVTIPMLQAAMLHDEVDVFKFMVERTRGFPDNRDDCVRVTMDAIHNGAIKILRWILETYPESVTGKLPEGAVLFAVSCEARPCTVELLDFIVAQGSRCDPGWTSPELLKRACDMAVYTDNRPALDWLLARAVPLRPDELVTLKWARSLGMLLHLHDTLGVRSLDPLLFESSLRKGLVDVVHWLYHHYRDMFPSNTLDLAMESNDLDLCEWLADQGFRVRTPTETLYEIAAQGAMRTVPYLVADHSDREDMEPEEADAIVQNAMMIALRHGHADVAHWLYAVGPSEVALDPDWGMEQAAHRGDLALVRFCYTVLEIPITEDDLATAIRAHEEQDHHGRDVVEYMRARVGVPPPGREVPEFIP